MITWPMASKVADFGHVKQCFKNKALTVGCKLGDFTNWQEIIIFWFSLHVCLFATCFRVKYSSAIDPVSG